MSAATQNEMERLRESAKEAIYLIPDSDEGRLAYVWCDDPAPGIGMDASEAVEYIRKDIHDAHSDMLEHRGDELQMMLAAAERERDAALEREQALAAHVEVLEGMRKVAQSEYLEAYQDGETDCVTPYDHPGSADTASLSRRDFTNQAEALEEIAIALKQWGCYAAAEATRVRAHAKRQQAAAL